MKFTVFSLLLLTALLSLAPFSTVGLGFGQAKEVVRRDDKNSEKSTKEAPSEPPESLDQGNKAQLEQLSHHNKRFSFIEALSHQVASPPPGPPQLTLPVLPLVRAIGQSAYAYALNMSFVIYEAPVSIVTRHELEALDQATHASKDDSGSALITQPELRTTQFALFPDFSLGDLIPNSCKEKKAESNVPGLPAPQENTDAWFQWPSNPFFDTAAAVLCSGLAFVRSKLPSSLAGRKPSDAEQEKTMKRDGDLVVMHSFRSVRVPGHIGWDLCNGLLDKLAIDLLCAMLLVPVEQTNVSPEDALLTLSHQADLMLSDGVCRLDAVFPKLHLPCSHQYKEDCMRYDSVIRRKFEELHILNQVLKLALTTRIKLVRRAWAARSSPLTETEANDASFVYLHRMHPDNLLGSLRALESFMDLMRRFDDSVDSSADGPQGIVTTKPSLRPIKFKPISPDSIFPILIKTEETASEPMAEASKQADVPSEPIDDLLDAATLTEALEKASS